MRSKVIKVASDMRNKYEIKIGMYDPRFANGRRTIHINRRANRAFERHIVQRVLGAQYGEIPLSAQQKRRKQNDAWFGINFMIPRP